MFTKTYTHPLSELGVEALWEQTTDLPFHELIVSWNARRPAEGKYLISVSVRVKNTWSDYLPYAEWGAEGQRTFHSEPPKSFCRTYQDIIQVSEEAPANAFRIKVTCHFRADLSRFDALHACASNLRHLDIEPPKALFTHHLTLAAPRSQMTLKHPRLKDLASPTSTVMAIDYLLKRQATDPLDFASFVHDNQFDIFGNWILNIAESYNRLSGKYACRVERLPHFAALHALLARSLPVVISLKGPLPNAPFPFHTGHLLLVTGWDQAERRVYCADPAHATDAETLTSYPVDDFLAAWARRGNLSYVFLPKH